MISKQNCTKRWNKPFSTSDFQFGTPIMDQFYAQQHNEHFDTCYDHKRHKIFKLRSFFAKKFNFSSYFISILKFQIKINMVLIKTHLWNSHTSCLIYGKFDPDPEICLLHFRIIIFCSLYSVNGRINITWH